MTQARESMRNGAELNLSVFDARPPRELVRYTTRAGIVPETRYVGTLVQLATQDRPISDRLRKRAEGELLAAFQNAYALSGTRDTAEQFYYKQIDRVNRQVSSLVDKFCPHEKGILGLGAIQRPPSPAEAVEQLSTRSADERKQYELQRQLGLALLAAEIDRVSQGSKRRMTEVENSLTSLFSGPETIRAIYSLHDNQTNAVLWTNKSDQLIQQDTYDAHLKKHKHWVREVENVGSVYHESRVKENSVVKAVRKAIKRSEKSRGEDTNLQPVQDVPDIMGMKFVVEDAFSSDDPKVTLLMDKVIELLTKRFQLPPDSFKLKDETNGGSYQSGRFRGKRLMVTFPDMKIPLEIMFHGMGDHLHNEFEIGEVDKKTGKPNGAAHEIMEIDRDITVLDTLFPGAYYSYPEWEKIKRKNYAEIVEKLQETHRVDPRDMTVQIKDWAGGKKVVMRKP